MAINIDYTIPPADRIAILRTMHTDIFNSLCVGKTEKEKTELMADINDIFEAIVNSLLATAPL